MYCYNCLWYCIPSDHFPCARCRKLYVGKNFKNRFLMKGKRDYAKLLKLQVPEEPEHI